MNNKNVSNKEYYEIYIPLLTKLAQRNNPNINSWWVLSKKDYSIFCCICNKNISDSLLREHGENHIKDSNLLPFL